MSEFIGKIGQHITANVMCICCVNRINWKSSLILFIDNGGNIITIQSIGTFKSGTKWTLDGKIKRHNSFMGQKQTHLIGWGLLIGR
jgi:hypothetical protein